MRRFVVALGLAITSVQAAAAGEGFGWPKKVVELSRINPPSVALTGHRITVAGKAQQRELEALAAQIQSRLASELVQHDKSLALDDHQPQTRVEVTVLQNVIEEQWSNRQETVLEACGKNQEGKTQYCEKKQTVRYQQISQRFGASYAVHDLTGRKTLFANSIDHSYRQEFREGQGAPMKGDLEATAVQRVVSDVVYNLTPTREVVPVLVPKGSLKDLVNLAEAGLWSRYSEAVEARPPLAKATDEAYRQYALGVAYEAMGYGADSPETTLRYLERAAELYDSALRANPKEDYFLEPKDGSFWKDLGAGVLNNLRGPGATPVVAQSRTVAAPLNRVQAALAKYQTLLTQNAVREETATVEAGGKAFTDEPSAPAAMSNKDVVTMIQGGVAQDIVLTAIDGAEACAFDVSPTGLVELSKAKVPKTIIQHLQARQCER